MSTSAPTKDRRKTNIVLTGFMGTGKTCVGKLLASALGMEFVDTDSEIEKRAGLAIPEIFARYGEGYFRRLEAEVVAEVAARSNCVIATGGGVVLNPENVARLAARGVIVLLEARPEVLARRLREAQNRPLLAGYPDLEERIASLLAVRNPFYAAACDFRVDTSDLEPAAVAARILAFWRERCRAQG